MDFKGIDIETRLKLKLMAANRGVPLYQLLDEMVEEAFEKERHSITTRVASRKFRKQVRKILIAVARTPIR